MWVYRHFSEKRRAEKHWVVAATAHPAKFEEIVEPLIGRSVEIPEQLAALLELPVKATRITPELDQLTNALG
jgi:threonine synthase